MSAVGAVSQTALLPGGGGGAFARALRDPRVVRAAKALDIDLQDPGALNALLDRTRRLIGQVAPAEPAEATALAPAAIRAAPGAVLDSYVRHAIRTYESVSRLI